MSRIRKVVIPAAGLGTRLLPATKAVPKELLPIVDRPAIHYIVEEAVRSGIEHAILITSAGKTGLEDYFDHNATLEKTLADTGKKDLLEEIMAISEMIEISSVRQKKPLGLGHAVLCAEKLVGNEPFAIILPDDIFDYEKPCIRQLTDKHDELGASVVGLMEVPYDAVKRYGIVAGVSISIDTLRLTDMVEKPSPESAPSRYAIPGRYVLTPGIFELLKTQEKGVGGEIQLTDAMRKLLKKEDFYGKILEGKRFDVGNKLQYLKANIAFSLKRKEFSADMKCYISEIAGDL